MRKFLLFIFIVIALCAKSQPTFDRVYGTTDNETIEAVRVTRDRGFIACGQKAFIPAINTFKGFLFRTDSTGNINWVYNYSSGPSMYFKDVQPTSDGGFIVVGNKYVTSVDVDVLLLKTDSLGNIIWSVSFGKNTSQDAARSVLQTADGGYVILGDTDNGISSGPAEVLIIKTDALGNLTWSNIYGGAGSDLCFRIKEVPGSGYITSGCTSSFGLFNDIYVLRIGLTGNLIWSRTYGRTGIESGPGLALTPDGGFMIAAHTNNYSPANYFKINLLKLKSNGDTAWTKSYYNSASQSGTGFSVWDMAKTSSNSYVITTEFNTTPSVYFGNWLKVDSLGSVIWGKTFITGDAFNSIMEAPGNGFIASAGTTWTNSPGMLDAYLLRTDSTGSWSCIQTADIPLMGSSNPIVQSVSTSKASFGVSNPAVVTRNLDLSYTVKGCDPNSIQDNLIESSISIFPNPSYGKVIVNSKVEIMSVKVFNELGQVIYGITDTNLKEIVFDISNNPNGIYFIELQMKNNTVRSKFIKN